MMSKKTRRLPLLMLVLALAFEASGCGQSYDGKDYSARGGEDATNGKVALDDVWIDGQPRLPAGARLVLHGEPVHRITVAPGAREIWSGGATGTASS